jgi:menaquinol-cytochrome c reductase iron-sulfur subunit
MSKSDYKQSPNISRREFVQSVTAILGSIMGALLGLPLIGFIVSPALRAKETKAWIPVGSLKDYPVGIPKSFSFTRSRINGWEKTVNSYGVFVIRKDETKVLALSNICTHLGCRVSWHVDIQEFVSPCHDGHFDINGIVTKGPPPRPLDEFDTKTENDNLYLLFPPFKRSNS